MGNIIFIDIPTYQIELEGDYHAKLSMHLAAEELIANQRMPRVNYQQGEKDFTLGLLTMINYLKQHGHNAHYFRFEDDHHKLLKAIESFDYVGLTAMTPVIDKAMEVAKLIKINTPGKKIVLGGYHASFMSMELIGKSPYIDLVVRGEGEVIVERILTARDSLESLGGITYQDSCQNVIRNADYGFLRGTEIPCPDYSVLPGDLNQYRINLSSVRGCDYNCSFCANHPFWKNERYRSLSSVISELDELKKSLKPGTLIHFSDNILTRHHDRVLQLCEMIVEKDYPFYFSCDVRGRHLDAKLVKAMDRAKFIKVSIGFEDACNKILNTCQKGLKYQDNLDTAKIIKDNSEILVNVYWLVALPGSSKASLEYNREQVSHLIRSRIVDTVNNKLLVIYPGTKFYEKADQFGVEILHKNWALYDRRITPMYRLENLDEEEIYEGFQKMEDVIINEYCNLLQMPLDILRRIPLKNLSRHTAARYLSVPIKKTEDLTEDQ